MEKFSSLKIESLLLWAMRVSLDLSILSLKAFFHHYKLGYEKNIQNMDYTYMSFFLPDTSISQNGSSFVDDKFGVQAKYHLLIFMESLL